MDPETHTRWNHSKATLVPLVSQRRHLLNHPPTPTPTPTHPATPTPTHTQYCIWTCTPKYTNHLSLPPNHHTVLRWTNYGTRKNSNVTHYSATALPSSEVTPSLKDHTASHNVQSFPQCFKSQSLMLSHHLANALLTHLALTGGWSHRNIIN